MAETYKVKHTLIQCEQNGRTDRRQTTSHCCTTEEKLFIQICKFNRRNTCSSENKLLKLVNVCMNNHEPRSIYTCAYRSAIDFRHCSSS